MTTLDFDRLLNPEILRPVLNEALGEGVVVALLDSGVDCGHPDLAGAVIRSVEVIDEGGLRCRDLSPDLPAPRLDGVGHGTACAGIIHQVAPGARLISVRVLGSDALGTGAQFVAGLEWVLNLREPAVHVVNLSLGTRETRFAGPLRSLVDRAYFEGKVLVAACSNMGVSSYPSQFASLISVDSQGNEDPLSFEYRRSSLGEVAARGVYVRAPRPGGGHQLWTGTSFACPHVTGIVARLLSLNPKLTPFQVKALLYALRANRGG